MSRVHTTTEHTERACSCLCPSCRAMHRALSLLDDVQTSVGTWFDAARAIEGARSVLAEDLGLVKGPDDRYTQSAT